MRKNMNQIQQLVSNSSDHYGLFDDSIQENDFLFNPKVKEIYDREGPFKLSESEVQQIDHVVDKCPYKLKNGVIYHG